MLIAGVPQQSVSYADKPEAPVTTQPVERRICMRISPKCLALALLGVTACAAPAKVEKPREKMTQRERDSTIAESGFIGSGVVKKALSVSAAEEKRAALYDSAGQ